ncbi:hypothetical protein ACFOON_14545 [Novosphingobium piscinae]|uniref:Uncharacterized protein n=1 Tax=Novosphingobium piscinae TaxID=1507448 RepID=A0A7X1G0D4_9SPHN|nr:hypothetical protein [Novosphingobium piscinae]MBC2670355.1 hypothetical protein [Novosphingobium piscinae]
MSALRTLILGSGLAAAVLTTATPALADHRFDRRGGDTTGAAIAGGIVGLAVGAAIASSARDDRFYGGPRFRGYYAYHDYPPRFYRDWARYRWERERWERRRWQYRRWDRGYPRYRHWDGPRGW